ncbi:MAG TPA: rhomboid family intramembrane serine protease [Bryobacteraceae bacterium]|nr:rhomboid family intramembrane serine protease [Bryobacteraceae bacterium]
MIPLRSTERVYSRTTVTISLIALNLVIFLFQAAMDPYSLETFVARWGIVPDQLRLITLLTSMFLHGGWLHVLGNMLFLWVFGRAVEDLIGGPKFLAFYILCGLLAAVAQVIINPYSRIPTIGASGAIAGVMGAYLLKFPRSKIVTLIPVFVFITTMELPAALLLVYWLVVQFFSGIGSLAQTDYTGGGVAWFAHIGGFLGGMLLIKLFPARQRWRNWYEPD